MARCTAWLTDGGWCEAYATHGTLCTAHYRARTVKRAARVQCRARNAAGRPCLQYAASGCDVCGFHKNTLMVEK